MWWPTINLPDKTGGRWEIIESAEHGKIEHASRERGTLALASGAEQECLNGKYGQTCRVGKPAHVRDLRSFPRQRAVPYPNETGRYLPHDVATFETRFRGMLPAPVPYHLSYPPMNDEDCDGWNSRLFRRDAQGNP
jgi:hypothetical protein